MWGKPFSVWGSHNMNALSDHPKWMFKKNSIGFFLGLDSYLYYFTVAVLLLAHDYMFFQNVL